MLGVAGLVLDCTSDCQDVLDRLILLEDGNRSHRHDDNVVGWVSVHILVRASLVKGWKQGMGTWNLSRGPVKDA